MLGRLEMTVDECIESYLSLSDQIFQKKALHDSTRPDPGMVRYFRKGEGGFRGPLYDHADFKIGPAKRAHAGSALNKDFGFGGRMHEVALHDHG